jgi:hypothetical protein
MPRRRRQLHQPELPAEVFNEIISLLWNDIPTLKACSLASRILTFPSQKRLFHSIALRAPIQKLRNKYGILTNGLCGTSRDFWRLLIRSPHIAEYVVSLHIADDRIHYDCSPATHVFPFPVTSTPVAESAEDETIDDDSQFIGYKLENGKDVVLDEPFVPLNTNGQYRDKSVHHRWLFKDKWLPLCAPLLGNLRSLAFFYDLKWSHLSGRVLITLLNLMQLPSLRYLQLNCCYRPDFIINQAIGKNVKDFVLSGYPEKDLNDPRFPNPPMASVYLDTLSIDSDGFLHDLRGCRAQLSRLRKLVVRSAGLCHHVAVWSLLQQCSATLQDLEITPSYKCMCALNSFSFLLNLVHLLVKQNVLATGIHEGSEDPINLGKLNALKRFAVRIRVATSGCATRTHFSWLSKILRSGYSTSVTQQLEELSIRVLYGDAWQRVAINISHWKDTFDTLLRVEFKNLRTLNILADAYDSEGRVQAKAVRMLNRAPAIARIRSRKNLVVDIRREYSVF